MEPGESGFSTELARYLLSLGFSDQLNDRYRELSEKAQWGKLTSAEEAELDDYLKADAIISILRSKARVFLKSP